jgi:hypothetical protein
VQREEFHVKAAAALDGRTVRGTLRVHVGALLVAEVPLTIRVNGTAARPLARDVEAVAARPYRRIFPSYSHLDARIVRQIEVYARTLGDTYLRDVTHVRAGEVWSARVADFIRQADIFQLFWSRNSMFSPWVRQEWEYALSLGRSAFIRPTYWETPIPEAPEHDLPPAALRALHFHQLPVTRRGALVQRTRLGSPGTFHAERGDYENQIADRGREVPRPGSAPRALLSRTTIAIAAALFAVLLVGLLGVGYALAVVPLWLVGVVFVLGGLATALTLVLGRARRHSHGDG